MRREISEPKHWRSKATRNMAKGATPAGRHHIHSSEPLPTEAVDAAFALESAEVEAVHGSRRDMGVAESTNADNKHSHPDLISSLSTQLTMLEAQHQQLSRLLVQAQSTQE